MDNERAVGTAAMNHETGLVVFMDPAPYLDVTGECDPDVVALLKQDYAGSDGELTAILGYIYQNIVTGDSNPSFSNALMMIAKVEMTHLDMLGDAIQTLGGSARFGDGRHYWQASVVNYADSIDAMLKANIDSESAAIASYEKQAEQVKNPSVSALLLRIAEDEKLHLRFFRDTLANMM